MIKRFLPSLKTFFSFNPFNETNRKVEYLGYTVFFVGATRVHNSKESYMNKFQSQFNEEKISKASSNLCCGSI